MLKRSCTHELQSAHGYEVTASLVSFVIASLCEYVAKSVPHVVSLTCATFAADRCNAGNWVVTIRWSVEVPAVSEAMLWPLPIGSMPCHCTKKENATERCAPSQSACNPARVCIRPYHGHLSQRSTRKSYLKNANNESTNSDKLWEVSP